MSLKAESAHSAWGNQSKKKTDDELEHCRTVKRVQKEEEKSQLAFFIYIFFLPSLISNLASVDVKQHGLTFSSSSTFFSRRKRRETVQCGLFSGLTDSRVKIKAALLLFYEHLWSRRKHNRVFVLYHQVSHQSRSKLPLQCPKSSQTLPPPPPHTHPF